MADDFSGELWPKRPSFVKLLCNQKFCHDIQAVEKLLTKNISVIGNVKTLQNEVIDRVKSCF